MASKKKQPEIVLPDVSFFGIRHHSPRSSSALFALLEKMRPECILVEGPTDARPLFEAVAASDTLPPVAILGYRTDDQVGSSFYPLASYSPEYVAIRWAFANKVDFDFIDIPFEQSIAYDRQQKEDPSEDAEPENNSALFYKTLADRFGCRSFEEFWEAQFEGPSYDPDTFRAVIVAYSDVSRQFGADLDFHRARDAFMAARIQDKIQGGANPSRTLVVAGAAHVAAFMAKDVAPEKIDLLPAACPVAVTLIPYSFTRLAEQTGYGAGNRAPRYYERAYQRGCDFKAASLEMLIEFCSHLRLRGFAVSLADTIEAYRLANMLAQMRNKSAPGLDEVRDAAAATLCRGELSHIDGFLWPTVVGSAVGKVGAAVAKNSLQQEFWNEVRKFRLPESDNPESFVLKLNDPHHVSASVFLHRLRISDVPYGSFIGKDEKEAAGGVDALSRVRETWQAQWTPATELALAERVVLGDSFERVCARRLRDSLSSAPRTAEAAQILLEAVVADIDGIVSSALEVCNKFAANDGDVISLANACRTLSGLVSYGTSRKSMEGAKAAIEALCSQTFSRVSLRIPDACKTDDDGAPSIQNAILAIHEIALAQKLVDKQLWFETARQLIRDYTIHPLCAGSIAGLLYVAREISDKEAQEIIEQRLTFRSQPAQAAGFVAGFLEVNALIIVRDAGIVEKLNEFILELSADEFVNALPMLRRAFVQLGATERRYLIENILKLTGASPAESVAILKEKDKEKLKTVSKEMGKIMKDLDDLL